MNKLLIGGLIMVFAGVATFAVVAAVRGRGGTTVASDAPAGAAGSDAAPVGVDAPAPPPADAPEPVAVDAGPAVTPVVDAGQRPPQKDAGTRVAPTKFGRLHVVTDPIRGLYVDGKFIHDAPWDMELSVGTHKVRLRSYDPAAKDEHLTIRILEDRTFTIDRTK